MYEALLRDNDETLWDWITWETLGNPDPKYQKGDALMNFGLWRADYFLLCRANRNAYQPEHDDGALGRGWVKIHVLEEVDYREHVPLIKTFLPCMKVDKFTGKIVDPLAAKRPRPAQNPGDCWVVMPYNYDDNGPKSRAFGTDLVDLAGYISAARLEEELPRWSTASRSSISITCKGGVDFEALHPEPAWPFRDVRNAAPNIFGADLERRRYATYAKTQESEQRGLDSGEIKFYSVKTGVQFVAGEDQKVNNKDILESNSLHAMKRSDLIHFVQKSYKPGTLKARYQIEVLCVQMVAQHATWDGFQVRDIGDSRGEVWFPALAIPGSGKAFAQSWGRAEPGAWADFWRLNFARPLGRAKGEMLALFGMQHMTANAQNMLIAFDRIPGDACKCVILRDIGDTLLNDHAFAVLRQVDARFDKAWAFETTSEEGVTLKKSIGGGYGDPRMTRVGATIVFFFPPFVKGDILLTGNTAKTLATWGTAHNESFLAYFMETVGYSTSWQDSQPAGVAPPDLFARLKQYAGKLKAPQYPQLVTDVLALHASQRIALLGSIDAECELLTDKELAKAEELVAAHDMLIGAEVECYLLTAAGKQALADLHRRQR